MTSNVILIDAAYADHLAGTLRSHFAAELRRDVPRADLAQWLVCMALDCGMTGDVQVVMVHDRETVVMQHVEPGNFTQQIDGKAFRYDAIGEFCMACCPVERVTTLQDMCGESLEALLDDKEVQHIAVAYDFDATTPESRSLTKRITKLLAKHAEGAAEAKDVTLFVMRPVEGDGFAQQLLGFSLMAAMGIDGGELQA